MHIGYILGTFAPWGHKADTDFDDVDKPFLNAGGLSDNSVCGAIRYELIGKAVQHVGDDGKHFHMFVNMFCEQLLAKWALPQEVEIGKEAALAYMQSRCCCKVLLFHRGPQLCEQTEAAVLKDCKAIDDAAINTRGRASAFTIAGKALYDKPAAKSTLQNLATLSKIMTDKIQTIAAHMKELRVMGTAPSNDLCERLTTISTDLRVYQRLLNNFMMAEFEQAAATSVIASTTAFVYNIVSRFRTPEIVEEHACDCYSSHANE